MSVEIIPTIGFARGAVVEPNEGGPNMLVVRGLGETTAVVVIEDDTAGTLRLREVQTADLRLLIDAKTPA
ncbi:hypothetical protein [Roseibium sp. TrichSKD4]|uniref:hypothetical protein n=1 Tax=Roseibium sp. TrichSKD4 TaxID=744980 RepID=UPI001111B758|nr:hypothetical protein [Roseibium sp. TrichSKD4]